SSSADDGAAAFNLDIRAHANQFLRVHEAVLENIFRDDRRAGGLGGERHVLRLHIGGEAGIFFRVHVGGCKRLVAHDADGVGFHRGLHASFPELLQDAGKVRGLASGDVESSRLDAVGDNAVPSAVEFADALHANRRRAGALNLRAHGVEQSGEVSNLGLTGAVLHDRLTLGKRRGHEQVFGAGYGNSVEDDLGAYKTISSGLDVTVLLGDLRTQTFQAFDVQIDGTGADGASAGQ